MSKVMLIGITGSIATGKSSVANYLKEKGYPLFDCDKVVHELYENDEILINKINDLFDNVVYEDKLKIDRNKLKQIIFNDKKNKKKLEELVHPIIKEKLNDFRIKHQNTIAFAEIPLLIEAKMFNCVDLIWLVTADYEIQLQRLISRNNLTEIDAKRVINNQISIEKKKKYANAIIDNNKDWSKTIKQIEIQLNSLTNII